MSTFALVVIIVSTFLLSRVLYSLYDRNLILRTLEGCGSDMTESRAKLVLRWSALILTGILCTAIYFL